MKIWNIFFLAFTAIHLSAEVPLPGKTDPFKSVAELETSGLLELKMGEKTETLDFGKGKSQYGMGLVFSRKNLPSSFLKTIGNNEVLQIALGNRTATAPDLVTQFGALTVKIEALPSSGPLKLAFQDTSTADKNPNSSAFLILNSSSMTFTQEDQEKLKTTLFSESGELVLTPGEKAEKIFLPNAGKKLSFRHKMFSLNIDAKIGTPFSGEKGTLKGTIQIPIFWPQGTEADAYVSELAETSLERNPEIAPPKEAPRTLASPEETLRPKKDKIPK